MNKAQKIYRRFKDAQEEERRQREQHIKDYGELAKKVFDEVVEIFEKELDEGKVPVGVRLTYSEDSEILLDDRFSGFKCSDRIAFDAALKKLVEGEEGYRIVEGITSDLIIFMS